MAKLKIEAKTISPRQTVLMAVLAIALIGAIYWPAEDGATLDAGPGPAAPAAAARLAAERAKGQVKTKKWPEVDLDAALAHDPFSSPRLTTQSADVAAAGTDDPATLEEQSADLLALKEDGVSMIVRDGASMVATVGERKLRVGDVIDGYRIVAIEMDGVVLERVAKNGDEATNGE